MSVSAREANVLDPGHCPPQVLAFPSQTRRMQPMTDRLSLAERGAGGEKESCRCSPITLGRKRRNHLLRRSLFVFLGKRRADTVSAGLGSCGQIKCRRWLALFISAVAGGGWWSYNLIRLPAAPSCCSFGLSTELWQESGTHTQGSAGSRVSGCSIYVSSLPVPGVVACGGRDE